MPSKGAQRMFSHLVPLAIYYCEINVLINSMANVNMQMIDIILFVLSPYFWGNGVIIIIFF